MATSDWFLNFLKPNDSGNGHGLLDQAFAAGQLVTEREDVPEVVIPRVYNEKDALAAYAAACIAAGDNCQVEWDQGTGMFIVKSK